MRRDMAKVLVERPRRGGGWERKGRAVSDPDLQRGQVGMLRQARESGGYKELNDHIAPLRRFLERQAGRPWDKVRSELREHIKPGNPVQEHLMSHVDNFLEVHVRKVEPSERAPCGLVAMAGTGWHGRERPLPERGLYVDPDDGIIKRARRRKIPKA